VGYTTYLSTARRALSDPGNAQGQATSVAGVRCACWRPFYILAAFHAKFSLRCWVEL